MTHPLFHDLPPHAAAVLKRISHLQHFEAGELLCREGDPADRAWFIIDGQVKISVRMPGGKPAVMSTVSAGAVLGELALMSEHGRRSATLVAHTPVETTTITRDDLCGLFYYNHPASLELMRRLSLRVGARILKGHDRLRTAPARAPEAPDPLTPGSAFDVRPFLPILSFFKGYPADAIDALLALGHLYTAPAGTLLYEEGEPAQRCYLVIRGALSTSLEGDAPSIRLSIAGPGACMGVMAMLMGSHHVHTCRAREESTLLALDEAALDRLNDPAWRVTYRFHRTRMRGLMETLQQVNRAVSRAEQQALLGVERWSPGAE